MPSNRKGVLPPDHTRSSKSPMVEIIASYIVAVGLDGSASSWKSFEEAVFIAKHKQAVLHIVSIHETTDASYSANEVLAAAKTERDNLEKIQTKARGKAEEEGLTVVTTILKGQFSATILDYLKKKKIDLLVLGDVGHSSIWGALLGTNVDKIVRNAPCSVLIAR